MRGLGLALLACALLAAPAMAASAPKVAEKPARTPAALPPGVQGPAEAPGKTPPAPVKTPAIQIAWRQDLDAAQKEAAQTGRIVLIFFHADWSQPCRLMDRGTFANPAIAQFVLRNFIPVKVDDSRETSPVSTKYQVRLYPTLLFLGPGGEPLHVVPGPRTPAELYPILQQVEALPRLVEAQRNTPDDREANFNLGNALAILNQMKRGEPYLKRAAQLAPNNENGRLSQARLLLAVVPLEDGDSALVLRNIDQWLREFKSAPEAPVAVFYQGTILFQDGKLREARVYFEQLRKEYPKHPKAYDADKAIEAIDARLRLMEQAKKAPPEAPPKPPAKQSPVPPKG